MNSLSLGQQRKLQLVIATIGEPEILVLDEPTAGLDHKVVCALLLLTFYLTVNIILGLYVFRRQDELNYSE
ncbi:ATP-binding cassette domain-containing protein [Ruminiclostridium papyrosolvens DSM 2782]|nr:ATP-binding cassette domain-containing protein [Ruminiclostridium papyrosolvens]WES36572.1 ATP-binding cassette domain-containing protein [Ruminiclostridium papyrosolvens DSM 2782]